MAKVFTEIDDRLRSFIEAQQMFFVATAPSTNGHVNVSPKGLKNTFAIVDAHCVAYLDLTGSGAETIAHIQDNQRITIMFCAFEGPPRIVRIYGKGEVVLPSNDDFAALRSQFATYSGVRAIIRVHATRIADSCGYAVPLYQYEGQRDQLTRWADRKGEDGIAAYKAEHNERSIDGLPALPSTKG